MPRSKITGSYGTSTSECFEERLCYFLEWLPQFIFLPTVYEGSGRKRLLLILNLVAILSLCDKNMSDYFDSSLEVRRFA